MISRLQNGVHRWYKLISLIHFSLMIHGCSSGGTDVPDSNKPVNDSFTYRETIVPEKDAGVVQLSGFKKVNAMDVLCQHWELTDRDETSHPSLIFDPQNGDRLYTGFVLFRDSSFVLNPRGKMEFGTWKHESMGRAYRIKATLESGRLLEYTASAVLSQSMNVSWQEGRDSIWMRVHSDGMVHSSESADPFYPANMSWRTRPAVKENDEMLKLRVRNCLRFYALLFRDVIKKDKSSITYGGLPTVFNWYNGGIGLVPRNEIEDNWVRCFYNKEQAIEAYDILKDLIVKHEFDWPRKTPSWVYKTHSVLEQMYYKLGESITQPG